jgi:hypothetical protein
MESTLVGVIKVDPKKLLEDGIRKELVLQIATTMDRTLRFNSDRPAELTQSLNSLAAQLDGFRRSFQCMPPILQATWRHAVPNRTTVRLMWVFVSCMCRHSGLRQHLWPEDLAGRVFANRALQCRARV